jgi:hypothetical protein
MKRKNLLIGLPAIAGFVIACWLLVKLLGGSDTLTPYLQIADNYDLAADWLDNFAGNRETA